MNTTISIRTNAALKKKAIKVLDGYGINLSSAFNMYLSDIAEGRTRPSSDIRFVPDNIMQEWEKEKNQAIREGVYYANAKDFVASLKK